MIKELVRLANHLDNKGCREEADYLDRIIKRAGPWEDPPQSGWEQIKSLVTSPRESATDVAEELKDWKEEQMRRGPRELLRAGTITLEEIREWLSAKATEAEKASLGDLLMEGGGVDASSETSGSSYEFASGGGRAAHLEGRISQEEIDEAFRRGEI